VRRVTEELSPAQEQERQGIALLLDGGKGGARVARCVPWRALDVMEQCDSPCRGDAGVAFDAPDATGKRARRAGGFRSEGCGDECLAQMVLDDSYSRASLDLEEE